MQGYGVRVRVRMGYHDTSVGFWVKVRIGMWYHDARLCRVMELGLGLGWGITTLGCAGLWG